MCDALGVEAKQELNPAQQEVLAELGAPKEQRPRFDAVLRHELQRALEDGLEPMLPMLDLREGEKPGDSMFVSKYAISKWSSTQYTTKSGNQGLALPAYASS